ncbi:MAG: FUSC family protein [Nitrososphaerota archaeon]|jgi:hypothetical protein|nr:FUSC family protein [Nitrososphaerota archaeon]
MTAASLPSSSSAGGSADRHRLRAFKWREADFRTGAVVGALTIAPLIVGVLLGVLSATVLVCLGTLNAVLAVLGPSGLAPVSRGVICAVGNAALFALGSVAAYLGPWVILFAGAGIFLLYLVRRRPGWEGSGLILAVMLVVGIGLPSHPFSEAGIRFGLVLVGGLWGLSLLFLKTLLTGPTRLRGSPPAPPAPTVVLAAPRSAVPIPRLSLTAGLTVAAGVAISMALRLPRDYWVMLTILVVLQTDLSSTMIRARDRVTGTILGAALGAAVVVLLPVSWLQIPLIGVFLAAAIAVQGLDYLLYALFLTPFVLVLLNQAFPGGVLLSEERVFDTILGSGLGILAAWLATRGAGDIRPAVSPPSIHAP